MYVNILFIAIADKTCQHVPSKYFTILLPIYPLVTNGLSHPYQMYESTFIFRVVKRNFSFLFHFSMNYFSANRIAPDGTPHFAASHMGPMSNKKDARLIWVEINDRPSYDRGKLGIQTKCTICQKELEHVYMKYLFSHKDIITLFCFNLLGYCSCCYEQVLIENMIIGQYDHNRELMSLPTVSM